MREHVGLLEALIPNEAASADLSRLAASADAHAFEVWGENTARGDPFPVCDRTDRVCAFVFPYVRGTRTFPLDILSTAHEPDDQVKFGAVYVAAFPTAHPVLRVVYSLPAALAQVRKAAVVGQSVLGSKAELSRIYWLGFHEEYFELASGPRRMLVDVHTLRQADREAVLTPGRHACADPELRREGDGSDAWLRSVAGADQGLTSYIEAHARPPQPGLAEVASPVLAAAQPDGTSLATAEKCVPFSECVPAVNWTWWCVPTAFTMVTCYHDNYSKPVGGIAGFGRLVGHWFDHAKSGHNVPDFIDKLIDPATGTWRAGFTGFSDFIKKTFGYDFSDREVAANAANDYAWAEIVKEIDAGRPFVWGVKDHATCAFGYQIRSDGKYVVLHTTWGDTPAQQREDWLWNLGLGMRFIVPGGATAGQNLVIWAPDGGESLLPNIAVPIQWYVWGNQIKQAEISNSPDGGKTWTTIAPAAPCTPGWNTSDWIPSMPTDRGRVRIRGLDAAGTLVAGDGSQADFKVLPGPRAVTLKTILVNTKTDDTGSFSAPHGLERFAPDGLVIRAISVAVQHTNGNWHSLELSHDIDNRFWWNSQVVAGLIKSPSFANRPVQVVIAAEAIVG